MLLPDNSFTMVRGSSKILNLTVQTPDGHPVDLTGARVVFSLKRDVSDTDELFEKTTDNSLQALITNARLGQVSIFLRPIDTKTLEVRQYIYDVWVHLPSGDEYPVIEPSVLDLEPSVTTLH